MDEFAREVAVLYWRSRLAAEAARFEVLDARLQKGQGPMSDEAWSALLDLHMEAHGDLLTAREHHADAAVGRVVTRPDGAVAPIDLFTTAPYDPA